MYVSFLCLFLSWRFNGSIPNKSNANTNRHILVACPVARGRPFLPFDFADYAMFPRREDGSTRYSRLFIRLSFLFCSSFKASLDTPPAKLRLDTHGSDRNGTTTEIRIFWLIVNYWSCSYGTPSGAAGRVSSTFCSASSELLVAVVFVMVKTKGILECNRKRCGFCQLWRF